MSSSGIQISGLNSRKDDAAAKTETSTKRKLGEAKRLKHMVVAMRQLYVMLNAGTPLFAALESLGRQATDEVWGDAICSLRDGVEEGLPLADAMAANEHVFDDITRAMIAAGERSGRLPEMIQRVATISQKELKLRGGIKGALMYPALLIGIVSMVLLLTLTLVVPRFASMFETLQVPLPPTTAILVGLSDVLKTYWYIVFPAGGISMGLFIWWLTTSAGRKIRDSVSVRLPIFGPVVRAFATARIIRLLGELVESHLPLMEVLELVRHTATNHLYQQLIQDAIESVTAGEPMSRGFDRPELVAPSVYEAIRSGESNGQLSQSLLTVADFLEEENDAVVKNLTTMMEPLILVVMGAVVGFLAISLFLPLFDLTAMAGEQ